MSETPQMNIVSLWPRETECALCGAPLLDPTHGLPLFQGQVVPDDWEGEWAGFDACPTCYAKHRPAEENADA